MNKPVVGGVSQAIASLIKERVPNLSIVLLSAYSEMPERVLWLVDEYVPKGAAREELVYRIESATNPKYSSGGPKPPLPSRNHCGPAESGRVRSLC